MNAQPDGGRWCIHVRDNGIGIDPSMAREIFTPFRRRHGRDEFCGSGAGLAIVKRIVERHGGGIEVVSNPGVGACFTFVLEGA